MKHLIFFSLVLTSVFKCTGARAEHGTVIIQPSKTCERVVADLRKIAWDDADAYDFENLKEQGTIKYMCGDVNDATKALCLQARALKCN